MPAAADHRARPRLESDRGRRWLLIERLGDAPRVVPLCGWPAPPPKAVPSQGLSKVQPSSPEVLTTDGRRIWGTRGEAVSDGAVEVCYGRYAERGGCAGQAAIAIAEKTVQGVAKKLLAVERGRRPETYTYVFALLQC